MALCPASCSSSLSPDQILRQIQINLLECKVCFERFSSEQRDRRPQSLSCGHVLCLECVTALSHPLLRKLECPFCRQLCGVDSTTHCLILADLQELLSTRSPTSPNLDRVHRRSAAGLHLCCAFGGWGTLINPTGISLLGNSGTVVVVHDGDKRVVVFSPQGKKLHSFGRRGRASDEIRYPLDVAVTPCGHVVVTDAGDEAVKVFTSRGDHMLTVRGPFQTPWGVDTDGGGNILVSDVQAGTLSRIKVNYKRGVVLEHQTSIFNLQRPKSVACCQMSGNTAVMEHLPDDPRPRRRQNTRLKVFSCDFHLLYQTDSFSLALQSTPSINMSAVAFDRDGGLIVIDSDRGMIWSFGKLRQSSSVPTPLMGNHLIRPAGLVSLNNTLIVLDSGDHAVKIYSAPTEEKMELFAL